VTVSGKEFWLPYGYTANNRLVDPIITGKAH